MLEQRSALRAGQRAQQSRRDDDDLRGVPAPRTRCLVSSSTIARPSTFGKCSGRGHGVPDADRQLSEMDDGPQQQGGADRSATRPTAGGTGTDCRKGASAQSCGRNPGTTSATARQPATHSTSPVTSETVSASPVRSTAAAAGRIRSATAGPTQELIMPSSTGTASQPHHFARRFELFAVPTADARSDARPASHAGSVRRRRPAHQRIATAHRHGRCRSRAASASGVR